MCLLPERVRANVGLLDLFGDPLVDVAFAVAEMAAGSEAGWSLAAVTPGVEGGEGHVEVVGELLG